jgi:hypothetical protein
MMPENIAAPPRHLSEKLLTTSTVADQVRQPKLKVEILTRICGIQRHGASNCKLFDAAAIERLKTTFEVYDLASALIAQGHAEELQTLWDLFASGVHDLANEVQARSEGADAPAVAIR